MCADERRPTTQLSLGVPTLHIIAGGQYVLVGELDLLHLSRSGPGVLAAIVGGGAVASRLASPRLVGRGRLAPWWPSHWSPSLSPWSPLVVGDDGRSVQFTARDRLQPLTTRPDIAHVVAAFRSAERSRVRFRCGRTVAGVGMALGSVLTQILFSEEVTALQCADVLQRRAGSQSGSPDRPAEDCDGDRAHTTRAALHRSGLIPAGCERARGSEGCGVGINSTIALHGRRRSATVSLECAT